MNISELSIPRERDVGRWPHLKGIELPEIDIKEVRVLIGCNVPKAFGSSKKNVVAKASRWAFDHH